MAFVTTPLPLTSTRAISRTSLRQPSRRDAAARPARARVPTMSSGSVGKKRDGNYIKGKVFVVRDNIDTDQIIPAEYLTLVPSNPEEYKKLGSYALIGLPSDLYKTAFVKEGSMETEYPIVVAGENFGCGSSREHAPVAMGACGGRAVVAQSYARIFFRNCSATGELYPWESKERLVEEFSTGDLGCIDFERKVIVNESTGREYALNDLGDVMPVIDAGGIFEYARQTGMIKRSN